MFDLIPVGLRICNLVYDVASGFGGVILGCGFAF